MKTRFYAVTHPGTSRQQNEDHALEDPGIGLYMVADGVTHPRGRECATRACEEVRKYLRAHQALIDRHGQGSTAALRQDIAALIRDAMEHASSIVFQESKGDPANHGTFAAVVAALVSENFAFIAHAGDARAYSIREGAFYPLTRDHTYLASMLAEGKTFAEARKVGYADNLFLAMGHQPVAKATIYVRELAPGERLLLCSDGLSDYFNPGTFLSSAASASSAAMPELLEKFALSRGGRDNITATVLEFENQQPVEKSKISPNVLVKLQAIRSLRIFQHLDDRQLIGLLSFADTRNYGVGDTIIRKGILTDEMHIVITGEFTVDVGRGPIETAENKGAILGEMSLFDGGLPSATVTVTKPLITLVFLREALFTYMRQDTGFAARFELGVLQAIIHRLRQRTEPDEETRRLQNFSTVTIFPVEGR
jgi:PPM family protein phosphatase